MNELAISVGLTKRIDAYARRGLLMAVFGLGVFLRILGLNKSIFWVDELGVAKAAFEPTLRLVLQAAHMHVMAMPLDYVVAWLMAHLSHNEWILRLPEALWGSLTLLAGYALYLTLGRNQKSALIGTLLLALSPILIEYSQELRFYAPLTFFFTLSLLLGIRAVERSRFIDWALFTIFTLIGLYFHFYLILVTGNVLLWSFVSGRKRLAKDHRLIFIASTTIIICVAFFIGLIKFGNVFAYQIPPFVYETFPSFLLTGLGWMPPIHTAPAGWILGILCMIFAIIGIIGHLKEDALSFSSVLFYGAVIQIAAVVALDVLKNYFVSARQLLMLAPVMIFFSACGADWTIERIALRWKQTDLQAILFLIFGSIFLLAAVPVLWDYFHTEKGSVADILAILSVRWRSGETVYVEPDFSLDLYAYYLDQKDGGQTMMNSLVPVNFDSANENGWQAPGSAWFVTDALPADWSSKLRAAGYSPVYIPPANTLYPQMLWRRP
jgi:hypothetical protein